MSESVYEKQPLLVTYIHTWVCGRGGRRSRVIWPKSIQLLFPQLVLPSETGFCFYIVVTSHPVSQFENTKATSVPNFNIEIFSYSCFYNSTLRCVLEKYFSSLAREPRNKQSQLHKFAFVLFVLFFGDKLVEMVK